MRIIAADSAGSFLDGSFMPQGILTTAIILVDEPYHQPARVRHVVADYRLTDPNVLLYELRLCAEMLESEPADCIHLDLSLGGVNLLSITDEMLRRVYLTAQGREVLQFVMPDLQELASKIGERFRVPVYAMGNKSTAVRLAELNAAAGGVSRAAQRALTSAEALYLGLPRYSRAAFENGHVMVRSLEPMEAELQACADVPADTEPFAFLNPVAREFDVLRFAAGGA